MTVFFAVGAARVFAMFCCVRGMTMRGVGVMSGLLVMAGLMVLGCFSVMVRCARTMFRGLLMVFRSFARHYRSLVSLSAPHVSCLSIAKRG